jgi:N-acetylglucosaminyldiphosphoundecaprenol N-acetyl-beta-D-mannosaminyltransferase
MIDINMRTEVLGLPVDILTKKETFDKITDWIRVGIKKPKMVVTAYSEFFVNAQVDREFAKIVQKADLVTPDGRSVLAAVKYMKLARYKSGLGKIIEGLKVGGDILRNNLGEVVTGVWLFEELTGMAEKKGWKVFLLGGWDNVSGRTAEMLLGRFPSIRVKYDAGERVVGTDWQTNKMVIEKINKFKPDLLFVAYNPIKQEKWIANHANELKVGVAMGVGGTFNEYLGEFKKAPVWMEQVGLKWLWRVMVEPKRLKRILKAVLVFPWLVFRSSWK